MTTTLSDSWRDGNEQEQNEKQSIKAWDKLWNEALTYIIADKMVAGDMTDFTEEEALLLMLIHERRLPAAIAGRASARV